MRFTSLILGGKDIYKRDTSKYHILYNVPILGNDKRHTNIKREIYRETGEVYLIN
jgi:hypothetical protein